ncbi:MAG: RNA pseudouridine synthase [Chloroflexi bacterium]|nr:MAG: RNA pseudouridine synthase [Chloroflexota bacterium]
MAAVADPAAPHASVRLVAGDHESGQRLDRWLAATLPDRSRSEIQRWIEDGRIWVNSKTGKASYRLEAGDEILVAIPPVAKVDVLTPAPIPLAILYEDNDLLVIDKPAGMVVHPAPGHTHDTLVNAVLHHCPAIAGVGPADGPVRPGIVHRLDKDTSGLIVVAKHDQAHRALQAQFQARTVYKEYLALVEGQVEPAAGRIVAPIGRHPSDRLRQAILPPDPRTGEPRGRPAVTEYRVLGYYTTAVRDSTGRANFSLVSAVIHTGRTHQIRVHFAWRKHPVVGDPLYGYRQQRLPVPRQFLHAHRLRFVLPSTGQEQEFVSPLPADLQQILDRLEEN